MSDDLLEWREVCKARGCEPRGNGLSQEMVRPVSAVMTMIMTIMMRKMTMTMTKMTITMMTTVIMILATDFLMR